MIEAALERLAALHPRKIDLSLGRIQRVLEALGRPQDRLPPVVHVAGTNGKGSTVAFLRAIAEAGGLRVHAYTSPHLVRFNERIRLAGRLIEDEPLANLLERVETANAGAALTHFEATTAAAFLAFSETPADLLLLEVGLGGRYDATNVVAQPALSVITPVDLDHAEFLGTDIAGIAREKAGILKPGAPAVSGRQREEAAPVIEAEAERVGTPLEVMGRDFDAWSEHGRLLFQDHAGLLDLPLPALAGPHQIANGGLAVAAFRRLRLTAATVAADGAVASGLQTAAWPARLQRLTAGPLAALAAARGSDLWLDGGHNPHAARALAEAIAAMQARDGRPTVLVCGMLGNKDQAGFFTAFADLRPRVLTVPFAATAAADPALLAEAARVAGLSAAPCEGLDDAMKTATVAGGPPPRILICGSLYLAGEVLARSPETWPT